VSATANALIALKIILLKHNKLQKKCKIFCAFLSVLRYSSVITQEYFVCFRRQKPVNKKIPVASRKAKGSVLE